MAMLFIMTRRAPRSTLFPYTTLFRSLATRPRRTAEQANDTRRRRKLGSRGSGLGLEQRSEEHTSELQSHVKLVCRLLLEKKNPNSHKLSRLLHNVAMPHDGIKAQSVI